MYDIKMLRLSARKTQPNPRIKYNVGKLKQQDTKQAFQISLYNRFQVLQTEEQETVEHRWTTFREAVVGACEDVLGQSKTNRKPWISDRTWQKVEDRVVVFLLSSLKKWCCMCPQASPAPPPFCGFFWSNDHKARKI